MWPDAHPGRTTLSSSAYISDSVGGRPAALVDLEAEARAVLSQAKEEACALLAETKREAEEIAREILRRAASEGYEQGRREGRESAFAQALEESRAELREAVKALVEAASSLQAVRQTVKSEAEDGLIRLAAAIGERLAAQQLSLHPELAIDAIREAISLACDRVEVRVLVNPRDHATLASARELLRKEFPEIVRISIEQDAGVRRGGAKVVTSSCMIDATLDSRAAKIARLLTGAEVS